MLTVQETTRWSDGTIRNHKYIVSDDMRVAYGYIKHGERLPELFRRPIQMDWRGRQYRVVVHTKDVVPNTRQWKVAGSKNNVYTVTLEDGRFSCTCPAATFRHVECKHIQGVRLPAK